MTGRQPRPKRQSNRATYDSRETGPGYHVTTQVGDQTIQFRDPIEDPFVRTVVHVGLSDILRCLLRHRRIWVTVIVGGDPDRVNDVMELDKNTLIANSSRRDIWNSHLNERLGERPGEEP